MIDDVELLRCYADEKSEAAFAELVRRHLNLVYSVALRQVAGDVHLAEDVTQQVFTALARKAAMLARRPALSGWLYRSTHFAASDVVRAERRRRTREQEDYTMQTFATNPPGATDWDKLRPVLDDAIAELNERDRDAVSLRFLEGQSFADVGARLRLTENAARMRVDRALDKLHAALTRRGVTSTAAAVGVALADQAGVAAPAGLAAEVVTGALGGAAKEGLLQFMNPTKLIIALAAVAVALGVGVAIDQASEARMSRAGLVVTNGQLDELQGKLSVLEGRLTVAEQRAKNADTDAGRLLKAIQDASPAIDLPPGDAPCIAFVIDTSGSMRDPKTDRLWSVVFQAISSTMAAHPEARFLQGLDADGRIIFGGRNTWLPRTPEALSQIERALNSYMQDTYSNPVPGIYRAMRVLPPAGKDGATLQVCVIGDEFNTEEQAESVLRRLDELNPADAKGHRRASISAIQLPTTSHFNGGTMASTGVRFQNLMMEVARRHAGTFKLLPESVLQ